MWLPLRKTNTPSPLARSSAPPQEANDGLEPVFHFRHCAEPDGICFRHCGHWSNAVVVNCIRLVIELAVNCS
jgi:hypothetical protein